MKIWIRRILPILAAALMSPSPGAAVGLGEINVLSFLGEPFQATIALQVAGSEEVDLSCLSLAPPPPVDDAVYLRRAGLSLSKQDELWLLRLTGTHILNEPYLIIVIQNKCEAQGRLIREYTVLIDPRSLPSTPQTEAESPSPTDVVQWRKDQPSVDASATQAAKRATRTATKPLQGKVGKKMAKPSPPGQDRLKVISGVGESQVQAEQSEKERLRQREKDLVRELDDKTAQFLAMQSQLEKLEARLVEMQKTIALQNKLMASMQSAAEPVRKPELSWKDYWLAGPFALLAGIGYLLAHRSRKPSLNDWQPTVRDHNTGSGKPQAKNPF